ncbi:MAG: 50S ribosomal protein L7 [Clostridia bacterium]|nr:50S ribosomal protein L7 [Clostridia bacterium]
MEKSETALRGLIGLCMRAGRLRCGTDAALDSARHGSACLLLVDAGASETTRKRLSDTSGFYGVGQVMLPEGMLTEAAGRTAMAAAVTDKGFAQKMLETAKTSGLTAYDYTEYFADNAGGQASNGEG